MRRKIRNWTPNSRRHWIGRIDHMIDRLIVLSAVVPANDTFLTRMMGETVQELNALRRKMKETD